MKQWTTNMMPLHKGQDITETSRGPGFHSQRGYLRLSCVVPQIQLGRLCLFGAPGAGENIWLFAFLFGQHLTSVDRKLTIPNSKKTWFKRTEWSQSLFDHTVRPFLVISSHCAIKPSVNIKLDCLFSNIYARINLFYSWRDYITE